MAQISRSIDINAPVAKVFDFVTNPHNTTLYSRQFNKFDPIGPKEVGLGARVEAAGNYMGMTVKTILEVTEYVPNKLFVSRSTEGVKSVTTWEFVSLAPDKTEVIFTSEYTMPGKGIGWLMDKLMIEKDVEKTTVETLVNLKKILENKPNLRATSPSHL